MNAIEIQEMSTNEIIIIVAVTAAIVLVAFLIIQNKKDRKEFLPPEATDPVEEEETEQVENKDKWELPPNFSAWKTQIKVVQIIGNVH